MKVVLFSLPEQRVEQTGRRAHELATELYPLCRSLMGEGVRRANALIDRAIEHVFRHL
jgi:aminopeptidase-like protein